MSTKVSQHQLARLTGRSRTRIRQYEAEGRISRDADGRYDLEAVQAFLASGIDHDKREARMGTGPKLGETASKARLHGMAYRSKLLQFEYEQLMASVISRDAAQETANHIADMIERRLTNWKPKFLAHLDERGRAAWRSEVDAAMREACEDLRDLTVAMGRHQSNE